MGQKLLTILIIFISSINLPSYKQQNSKNYLAATSEFIKLHKKALIKEGEFNNPWITQEMLAEIDEQRALTDSLQVRPSIPPSNREDIAHLVLEDWGWTEEDLVRDGADQSYAVGALARKLREEKEDPDMMQVITAWQIIAKHSSQLKIKLAQAKNRKTETRTPLTATAIIEELEVTVEELEEMQTTFSVWLLLKLEQEAPQFFIPELEAWKDGAQPFTLEDWYSVQEELDQAAEIESEKARQEELAYQAHQKELDRKIEAGLAALRAAQTTL